MEHSNQQPAHSALVTHETCPASALLHLLTKTHALLVLHAIEEAPQRFIDIERQLQINTATLTKRLKDLTRFGLILRSEDTRDARVVRYSLSSFGVEVADTIETLGSIAKKFHEKRQ